MRNGYPFRTSHQTFFERYHLLVLGELFRDAVLLPHVHKHGGSVPTSFPEGSSSSKAWAAVHEQSTSAKSRAEAMIDFLFSFTDGQRAADIAGEGLIQL